MQATTTDEGPTTVTATTLPSPTLDAERADLLATLAAVRSALTGTVRGLGAEELGERPTVSALCLGGLIKHVTSMEEGCMRFVTGGPEAMGHDLPEGVTWADIAAGTAREIPRWMIDYQDAFAMAPGETPASILARYERVAARSEEIVAAVPDLSAAFPLPEAPWNEPGAVRSVRRTLMHLIAETAQHAGHAEILRETLDGHRST
ncbi:DinB family protein [Sphaerisporangium corydalis]|uniref:DinB family protein n=1 Tax=Sphaerisporangium corydalis TaxID=1441875 RepID=A0ABV9EE12_9ACTN|nr:DinB family protein [Sphaerisporangium corydalis]